MKSKILGLLAAVLLVGPVAANAAIITISGSGVDGVDGDWDVTVVTGTGNELLGTLESQIWFGNAGLALLFADTVGDLLGFPNGSANRGPHFLAVTDGSIVLNQDPFQGYRYWLEGATRFFQVTGDGFSFAWAVATRVESPVASVPEPTTLALLGLGLLGMGYVRRRKHH
jgi:hypothetical protein